MVMNLYAIFRFLFEVLCLVIAGYWGFSQVSYRKLRFILGIAAPLSIIIVWSIWVAPSSPNRLQGLTRLMLELGIYAFSAVCLYHTNFKNFVGWFILIAIANASINYFTNWLI